MELPVAHNLPVASSSTADRAACPALCVSHSADNTPLSVQLTGQRRYSQSIHNLIWHGTCKQSRLKRSMAWHLASALSESASDGAGLTFGSAVNRDGRCLMQQPQARLDGMQVA